MEQARDPQAKPPPREQKNDEPIGELESEILAKIQSEDDASIREGFALLKRSGLNSEKIVDGVLKAIFHTPKEGGSILLHEDLDAPAFEAFANFGTAGCRAIIAEIRTSITEKRKDPLHNALYLAKCLQHEYKMFSGQEFYYLASLATYLSDRWPTARASAEMLFHEMAGQQRRLRFGMMDVFPGYPATPPWENGLTMEEALSVENEIVTKVTSQNDSLIKEGFKLLKRSAFVSANVLKGIFELIRNDAKKEPSLDRECMIHDVFVRFGSGGSSAIISQIQAWKYDEKNYDGLGRVISLARDLHWHYKLFSDEEFDELVAAAEFLNRQHHEVWIPANLFLSELGALNDNP